MTRDHLFNLTIKYLFIVLLSLVLALCFGVQRYIPFIVLSAAFYLWLLIKYPEIGLFISILFIFDFFSIMSRNFLRVEHVFRLKDAFFLSTFIPLLIGIYQGDVRVRLVFKSKLAIGIYIILFLTVMQLFLTKLRFPSESFDQ